MELHADRRPLLPPRVSSAAVITTIPIILIEGIRASQAGESDLASMRLRSDRFVEVSYAGAFESGLLTRIARRAEGLATAAPSMQGGPDG